MAAAESACPACGENALISDQLYCSEHVVCAECGYLSSEVSFAEPPPLQLTDYAFKDANVPNTVKYAILSENGRSIVLQKCLARVSKIGNAVRLPGPAIYEARLMFQKIYQMDDFKHRFWESKWIMCACCVYICCRERAWPITMQAICELAQSNKFKFGKLFKQILIKLNREIPQQSMGQLIASVLGVRKRMFSIDFINRTRQLLQICQTAWIVTGRNITTMITAAAYIVWLSSFAHKITRKCAILQFSKTHHMAIPINKHINEIQDLLCTLSKNLPWVSDSVKVINRRNVHAYLDDILTYEKTLLYEARKNLSDECNDDIEESPSRLNDVDNEHAILQNDTCQRVCIVDGKIVAENSLSSVKDMSDRYTFLPPAIYNPKQRKRRYSDSYSEHTSKCSMSPTKLNSTNISAIDIGDSDMHLYIRSDKEIRDRKDIEDVLQSIE